MIFDVFRSIGSFNGISVETVFIFDDAGSSRLITVQAILTIGSVKDFLKHRQIGWINIVNMLLLTLLFMNL